MDKALTNYTYVRKYGNSLVAVISKECEILKIKPGELVKFRITKIQPEEPEELPTEITEEPEKPKKSKKEKNAEEWRPS